MSKERARRREEREREAAIVRAARAREAEKRERKVARSRRLSGLLPKRHSRQTGVLAERRRRQVSATAALLIGLNVLVWVFVPDWSVRALIVAVSLLAAPVLHTLLFRR
jgi:ABC-type antimicrobial peptide transport system ATPase subunit